jgi:hypothetical protein
MPALIRIVLLRDMVRPGMLVAAIVFALMFGFNKVAVWSWHSLGWLITVFWMFGLVIGSFLWIENGDRARDGRPRYSMYDAGRDFREAWPDMRFILAMGGAAMVVIWYFKYLFFPSVLGVPF